MQIDSVKESSKGKGGADRGEPNMEVIAWRLVGKVGREVYVGNLIGKLIKVFVTVGPSGSDRLA
jgi:hypothetical protein